MAKRLISLRVCVARSIHNHDNTTRAAQRNAQYAKLLVRRGYSTVYYAQNNSRAFVKSSFFIGKLRYENVYKKEYVLNSTRGKWNRRSACVSLRNTSRVELNTRLVKCFA